MNRCVVLGGAGFVGAAFSRRLQADGYDVTVVDNLVSEGSRERFDQLDPPRLFRVVADVRYFVKHNECEYDLVVHCAAIVGGRLKIEGDPLAVAEDLAIDSDVLRWVVKAKNRPKVVYFSSSAVYPIELQRREQHVKLSESLVHPVDSMRIGIPDVSYGWSKLTGELLAQWAVRQYGCQVLVYRPFSGYGEDQSFDYPFPSIIRRVVNRENPITIWGSGEQCRDFIHIDDIVEAVMQTKDVLKPGEVLNLGTGIATSFHKLARLAAFEVLGGEPAEHPEIVCDTTKPEGVFYRVADTYKLDQFYKPKISLNEGIERVAAHLRRTGDVGF